VGSSRPVGYHAGELAVQRRTGEAEQAQRLLRGVDQEIPAAAARFLAEQRLLFTATERDGEVWAGVLEGPRGFAHAEDARTIVVDGAAFDGPVGLLALEPATRRRMRANGSGDGTRVHTEQVYANCPKYIQRREIVPADGPRPAARDLIATADTFFIASAGPDGLDISHRGGEPGFVQVDGDRLWFPDYTGNTMYMTLGNLVADGRAGLLFLDWENGNTLQLTGRATVGFEPRGVTFEIERAVHTEAAVSLRWALLARSRFNPPPRRSS
jgi:predicted pyridoxine 5'-phosphate oxidase superfamily flavin-nucleotide-binding protein